MTELVETWGKRETVDAPHRLAALEAHFPESALFIVAADGRFLSMNERAAGLVDRDNVTKVSEAVEPDDAEDLATALKKVASGHKQYHQMHIGLRQSKGAPRRLQIWITPLDWSGDRALLIAGHDLTALHEEASRFREIAERGAEGIIIHRGDILYVNQRLAEMVELSGPEALAETDTIEQFVHPADREMVTSFIERRLRGENVPLDYEFRLMTANEQIVWVNCRADNIVWDGMPAIIATVFDISEKKEADRARAESENLFRLAFDLSPNDITLSRLTDGTLRYVNETFLRDMRYTEDEVIGKTAAELGVWSSETPRSKFLDALDKEGTIRNQIVKVVRSDGTAFEASISGTTLTFQGEQYMLLVGNDVTEQNRQRRELHESKRAAELANRAKSEFLANISHELRTPLNAIIGFAELMHSEALGPIGNEQYRDYNNDILEAGRHLLTIINDILDLSKLEAGRLTVDTTEVDLSGLISSGVRLIGGRATAAELTLDVRLPDERLIVLGDPIRLKQVLINLLSNAVKFTPAGGRVEVSAECIDDETSCFSVSDSGVGMSEEEVEKALTPFEQIESSLTRRNVGTGLGLPLVNALVKLQGGKFALETAPGEGTVARVTLPAVRTDPNRTE